MKRRLALILTAVVLLGLGIAVAVGSTGSDPMISLSYWENTYLPALADALQQRANTAAQSTYSDAAAKLDAAGEADLAAAAEQAGAFSTATLKTGDVLELDSGGSAIVQSGSAALSAGTLADVTAGSQVMAGEDLTVAHRYVVTSASASLRQLQPGTVAYQGAGTVRVSEGSAPGGQSMTGDGLPFADVTRDQWFYSAVAYVYEKSYFSGTGPATFAPNEPMSRAMVATVLHRVAGSETVSGSAGFSDVPEGQWYSAGVAWASAKGIVNGMGNGLYAPDATVTREQLVTMLYRFEKDYRKVSTPATGSLERFTDGAQVSSWAQDAMRWAVGAGLIQGRDTGALDPTGTASRAEVAAILQRFAARM